MKRLRLLVVLGVVAAALPLGLSVAHATGGGGSYPTNSVSINYYAQYDLNGDIVHLGLNVRCKDVGLGVPLGNGEVSGSISQSPPQTPYPMVVNIGANAVVCDGNTHAVGLSVQGVGLDAGLAKATVTLTPPLGGGSSVTKTSNINIVVMNP
jgi:hypothetical protein